MSTTVGVSSSELMNAYMYAHYLGVTSAPSIQDAHMDQPLSRAQMAKMIVVYAVKVYGLHPDTTKLCQFTDIAQETPELQTYIELACQLGLMGVRPDGTPKTIFTPENTVSRADFGTVFSRILWGTKYDTGEYYYTDHLQALKKAGIMTNIIDPLTVKELRGRVMLMMMRAKK